MNKPKNLKVVALIFFTSTIILAATSLPNIAAATQDSMYVYNSIGGRVSTAGTDLTGGESYNYNDGTTVEFTATPDSGYQFLGWVIVTSTTQTSTANPLPFTFSSASCALQPMFVPTSNATAVTHTTGTSMAIILLTAGGTTQPAAGTYENFTVGSDVTLTAVSGTGFKFLYWIIAPTTGNTYTTSQVTWKVTADAVTIQAFFVPTSSTLSIENPTPTPSVPEYSGVATVIIAVALVAISIGTYTYRRKVKQ